ncbi:hypothetical protein U1E44_00505 [Arenibacter sp. GZD96]|uniref:hypothetical protein n=1 Tax=Aurantibrevibacter litoralis TaxID=3106030 RepID=UPI002AFE9E17|nr:hypothetical protein [Arenibacter sp. GZD-96]MEA1784559.1 hypothetical protein [Arenibacter sp. GZD-96]
MIEEYNPIDKYVYYKFKGSGNNGQFFFIEKGELPSISAIKENCFKKYIENLDLKFKVLKGKGLNDMVLFDYFIDYTIIMRKNNRLIKLEPNHVIE